MQSLATAQFQTTAEVDAYLGRDTVECLLCGEHFQRLSPHLQRTHEFDPRDYRRQFAIPLTRSLTSARARETYRRAVTPRLIEAGLRQNRVTPLNERPTAPKFPQPALLHRLGAFHFHHHPESAPPALTPADLRQINAPFRTPAEAERYLSRDYIACLICGEQHLMLDAHVHAHGLTAGDYRRRFHIPRASALCCPRFLGMRRALIATERFERARTGLYDHLRPVG